MFVKCKLLLTQDNKSLEVTLDHVTGAAFPGGVRAIPGVTFWGRLHLPAGSNIPVARRAWIFSLPQLELRLMDQGGPGVGMTGDPASFEPFGLPPSAVLSRAIMTHEGLKPLTSSGVGVGQVFNGFDISVQFHQGPVTWALDSFWPPGARDWQSPE